MIGRVGVLCLRSRRHGHPHLPRPRADPQPVPLEAAGDAGHLARGGDFLFGGCGLGAAIAALEGTAGRPCVWATAQYLSFARPGEVVDIDVTIAVEGHQITQARAVGHVGRPRDPHRQRRARGPADFEPRGSGRRCRPTSRRPRTARPASTACDPGGIDQRHASSSGWPKVAAVDRLDGTPGDGRTVLWARIPEVLDGVDGADAGRARRLRADGRRPGARASAAAATASTTRCGSCELVPTEWVLLDIRVHAVEPRLRPRPRAPVRRGRHAAGHGQPERASCASGTSPAEPADESTLGPRHCGWRGLRRVGAGGHGSSPFDLA